MCQKSSSPKALDETSEVDKFQKSSSSKVLDETSEVDTGQQVMEDELGDKKGKKEEVVKEEVTTKEKLKS